MIFELSNCPICGSNEIIAIDREFIDDDTYIVYKCKACDGRVKKSKVKIQEKTVKDKELIPSEIYEKCIGNIFVITSLVDDGGIACGTGFCIGNNGYIMTNAHVVTNVNCTNDEQLLFSINDRIKAKRNDGKEFDCEVINVDLIGDMAILKLSEDIEDVELSMGNADDIKTGDKVLTIGNSKGEGMSITEGLISDKDRVVMKHSNIMVSIPVNNGNSGGPLLNMKAEVIGMITFGKRDAVAMNYAIPIKDILEFIKKTEVKEEVTIL